MKTKIRKIIKSITNAPKKIYNMIDQGDPKWIGIFKLICIEFPIKRLSWERKRNVFVKSILPKYCNYTTGCWIFLHTSMIPEGSNSIMEVKKIKELLEANGFMKQGKAGNDADTYNVDFLHEIYKNIKLFVYIDEVCDIEYVDVIEKKAVMTGICAKILEELNTN